MKIANSNVLITGANRGIGLAFARAFLERGAHRVYAAARDPSLITAPRACSPSSTGVASRAARGLPPSTLGGKGAR